MLLWEFSLVGAPCCSRKRISTSESGRSFTVTLHRILSFFGGTAHMTSPPYPYVWSPSTRVSVPIRSRKRGGVFWTLLENFWCWRHEAKLGRRWIRKESGSCMGKVVRGSNPLWAWWHGATTINQSSIIRLEEKFTIWQIHLICSGQDWDTFSVPRFRVHEASHLTWVSSVCSAMNCFDFNSR